MLPLPATFQHCARYGVPIGNAVDEAVCGSTAEGPLDVTLLAYADDMVINGFSTEDAQHNVRVLSEYLGDVGLVLSAKKTKAMRIPQEIVRPEGWKPETLVSVTGTLRQQRGARCAPHGEMTQATLRVDNVGTACH